MASPKGCKRFLQSQKALESVVEHTEPIPGVEGDVHVQNFDHVDPDTNEAALMWWFKQRIEEINPDVIAGQNIKDYDNPNRTFLERGPLSTVPASSVCLSR